MKIDLGSKPYDSPEATVAPGKEKHVPYYPSTEIEDEDIPDAVLGEDIKCEVTVCVTRSEVVQEEGKDKKKRFRLEFRKLDFKPKLKDQGLQDDISDAIENVNESKSEEDSEDSKD